MFKTWPARSNLLFALGLAACGEGSVSAPPGLAPDSLKLSSLTATTSDARVVLVTIDGVRWQDVFEGSDPDLSGAEHLPPEELMPRTYGLLADRGLALGADREGCATVHTAGVALEYFRAAKPALFHIGLGDTDEWGHRGDYGAYLTALHRADALIGDLVDTLDSMGDLGRRTTVIVTPDHGRNSDFQDHSALRMESGRTFMLLFGERVATHGIGCPRRDLSLADIAPTIRALLGLPRDVGDGAGTPLEEIQ